MNDIANMKKILKTERKYMRNIDLTNTVDASNQLGDGKFLRFGEVQGSPKILFAGNSMAWHAPKDDIGWSGDWGMAASKRENDYVHQTMRFVREKYKCFKTFSKAYKSRGACKRL